jgi:hypothetical protein
MSKLLFWGKYSQISGGHMPNLVTGKSDYLTVAGSIGSETYQTPQTDDYMSADNDLIWYNSGWQIVTTANLIGYDFTRTLVKYDDTNPYQIREIAILKANAILSTSEENYARDYFALSLWWFRGGNPIYLSGTNSVELPNVITLTFSLALDPSYVPTTTDFVITGKTVSNVVVSGTNVVLTLSANFNYNDPIIISYTKPVTNYLRSTIGDAVFTFDSNTATNMVPEVSVLSIAVANATPTHIDITFNHPLNESSIPDISCFTILNKTVSSVSILGSVVTVIVSASYAYSDTITVSYVKPSTNSIQGLDGSATSTFTGLTGINNINMDSDALALFTRMATADGVEQTNARKININKTIVALKAASLWSTQFDVFVVTRAKGAGSQLLNWISTSFNATAIPNGGTLTQIDDVGINSDGTKSYINTNYSHGLYTRDDASAIIKMSSEPSSGIALGSTYGSIRTVMGETAYTNINGANYVNTRYIAAGYTCLSRDGATSWNFHQNTGTTHFTDASTGILTTYNFFIFALDSGSASQFLTSTSKCEFYAFGKSLSQDKFLILQTIINAYIAAL